MPTIKFLENSIWFDGPPGVLDADPAIQRQIATADLINVERGVASDQGLTGGSEMFSIQALFQYIDRLHAKGKSVNFQQYSLDAAGLQYGLASYFLISKGTDTIGDGVTTPDNWFPGYSVDLGLPIGPRTYKNGVFERDFTGGKVLMGEPDLPSQTVDLGGSFTTLDGASVTSLTLASKQGYVLLASTPQIGVLNAASQSPGALSPGEIVSVWGSFNASAGTPTVLVNGVAATILAITQNQLNVVVPFGLDLSQAATVQVQQGQNISSTKMQVASAAPAIFTANGSGSGGGAILNQDFSINSSSNPAAPGSVIMVYATGLGAIPSIQDGAIPQAAASTSAAVTATVGGAPAQVLYAGTAPGLIAGVFQVNILMPSGVARNSAVPISLQVGGITSPNGVTVSLQ
jgi:uncharacterized protein (TIGR03437 family)